MGGSVVNHVDAKRFAGIPESEPCALGVAQSSRFLLREQVEAALIDNVQFPIQAR